MNLLKIDHVHIYVADLKEAERWYQHVLGFSRLAEHEPKPPSRPQPDNHFGIK